MNTFFRRVAACAAVGISASAALRIYLRRSRRMSFRDRVVLITGASRGLGLVMARQFGQEGARLAICARNSAELARAQAELEGRGFEVYSHVCDVRRQEEVESLIEDVETAMGPIHVLINNAGIICVGPEESMTLQDFEDAMQTHYWGPLYTMQKVLPGMQERGFGRIVNIASIGGKLSVPHLIPYCGSKFALVGLSRGMRTEFEKDGIFITTVCPGLMRTGSPRNAVFKGQHRAEYTWFSISASLPAITVQAERAARRIIDACRHGDAELIISVAAKLGVLFDTLSPDLSSELFAVVNQMLPGPTDRHTSKKGFESESPLSPSLLTTLNERAAEKNNEVKPEHIV